MTELLSDDAAPAIRWDRVPASAAAKSAIERLTTDLVASMKRTRALRRADRERLQETVGALVAQLFVHYRTNKNPALRLSRAEASYLKSKRNRYSAHRITHTNACRVADWLVAEGYAGSKAGYYQRYPGFGPNAGAGQQSRIWATTKLAEYLEREYALAPRDFGFAPWLETVILREKEEKGIKTDVEYEDTDETNRMRSNLATINAELSRYCISRIAQGGKIEDLPPFRLARIFSRGSFGLGGRFYRGPWIEMPQEDRSRLLIDGEEVVELDYSALHPRLIYAFEGKLPVGDPYSIPGWEEAVLRNYVKNAFQQLLNATPDVRLRKPQDVPTDKLPTGGWQRLLRELSEHHGSINHWFRSGRGLELQRVDSDMAESVVLKMLGRGVCCLPIHDSFIVPASARGALQEAMDTAFEDAAAKAHSVN